MPTQATDSGPLFYGIFIQKKSLFSKLFDDFIARDLRFDPNPNQNCGYAYVPIKCFFLITVD